jgi:hypothetical protein
MTVDDLLGQTEVVIGGSAAGFVDSSLSAELLDDELEARRDQLRATLPIGRLVRPTSPRWPCT